MGVPLVLGRASQGAYRKIGARFLPGLVSFILVLILAYQLAGLTWTVFKDEGSGDKTRPASTSSPLTQTKSPGRGSMANELVSLHLFGVPERKSAKPVPRKAVPTVAPVTSLSLTLFGVFADTNPALASAIIGKSASNQRYYLVGDVVSKGVTLEEVREDQVILSRNGKYETLRFPVSKGITGRSSSFKTIRKQYSKTPSKQPKSLASYAEILRKEPLKLMEYLRFAPIKEKDGENLKGFRVSPRKDRNFFNKLGLNSSDIIVSVNGVSLAGKSPHFPELLKQVSTATQIDLQVLRNGKVRNILLDIGS